MNSAEGNFLRGKNGGAGAKKFGAMCGSPVAELLSNFKAIHLGFLDAAVVRIRREHILAKILGVLQEFRKTGAKLEFI